MSSAQAAVEHSNVPAPAGILESLVGGSLPRHAHPACGGRALSPRLRPVGRIPGIFIRRGKYPMRAGTTHHPERKLHLRDISVTAPNFGFVKRTVCWAGIRILPTRWCAPALSLPTQHYHHYIKSTESVNTLQQFQNVPQILNVFSAAILIF